MINNDHSRGVFTKQAKAAGMDKDAFARHHGMSPGEMGKRARQTQKHARIAKLKDVGGGPSIYGAPPLPAAGGGGV